MFYSVSRYIYIYKQIKIRPTNDDTSYNHKQDHLTRACNTRNKYVI